ncbi:ABC transporter ATP-binding protein [Nonomuraea rosea]|uniref:ABC transporter ATP-binding protein n=1 Tax=Nonomuraea rosea TaxID=638574 RepID=A0ABP6XGW1_9ACTN
MIEIRNLTKRFGDVVAVDDLTFTVRPGTVTGFLGPNGAGKTTTMRSILGIDRPTSGSATVAGRHYSELPRPMRQVGSLLDARAVHPARKARDHLLWLARSNGIPARRVGEVLETVGLEGVGGKRSRGFSLGMEQRLGIAAALLGDPPILMLDEPVNGLDPEGIVWIRTLLRSLADEGRTIFISSHLMSEMSLTADHLIVIGRGRLIADTSLPDFIKQHSTPSVLVRTPNPSELATLLKDRGAGTTESERETLVVTDLDSAEIFGVAVANDIVLYELTPRQVSLEEAFMELTREEVEYR